jgi:PKD repeat protein
MSIDITVFHFSKHLNFLIRLQKPGEIGFMRKSWLIKARVCGIIMLFFGAGVSPCFKTLVVKAGNGNSNLGIGVCDCGSNNNKITLRNFDENYIYYYNSVASGCAGLIGGGTTENAIRLTSAELSQYAGKSITAARYYHCSSDSYSGNLKIYGQGTDTTPGSLLTSQSFTVPSDEGWFRVDLSSPITISGDSDIWVSFEQTYADGNFPIGFDNGPAIDGKGDWIYFADYGWYEWQYQADVIPGSTSYDNNFNIEAVVGTGGGNLPPVADFTWSPQNPNPGETVLFDASASHDPDGYIILYEWDWNNDGVYEESDTSTTATHSWSDIGGHNVNLRVTDNDGATGTKTKSVWVGPPFNPPAWLSVLMDLTGTTPTWQYSYWYLDIPYNTNYIPQIDESKRGVSLPWPFGGDYLTTGDYSCDLIIKYYPQGFGGYKTDHWDIRSTGRTSKIQINYPIDPKWIKASTTLSMNWDSATWDKDFIYVEGSLGLGITLGTVMPIWIGFIPVSVHIGLDGGLSMKSEFNSPAEWIIQNGEISNVYTDSGHAYFEITVKGGIGFDAGWLDIRAELGGYGKVTLDQQITPPPHFRIEGEIGIYGEIWIFEGSWVLWSGSWPDRFNNHIIISNDDWQVIPRIYGEQIWQSQKRGELIKEVFPFAHLNVATLNQQKIMVWEYDNQSKPQLDGLEIQYTLWNGSNWSTPNFITQDNNCEMYPSVAFLENGDAVCVFTKTPENVTGLEDFYNQTEIAYSRYDHTTGSWSDSQIIYTTPELMDSYPVIASDGNHAVVVWTCDKDGNMFTVNDTITYTSFFDDGAWHDTQVLSTENIISNPLSLDYKNGTAALAYVTDADGNLSTTTDHQVFVKTFTSSQVTSTVQLTNDESEHAMPSVKIFSNNPCVAWVTSQGNLSELYYQQVNNGSIIKVLTGEVTDPYLFSQGDKGNNPIIGFADFDHKELSYSKLQNGEWQTHKIYNSNRRISHAIWDYSNSIFSATFIEKDNASSKTNCSLLYLSNAEPVTPAIPSGPSSGIIETNYTYNSSTTDSDNDQIYYLFDWGDGTTSDWLGPYDSSTQISTEHQWQNAGIYDVRVKAKDTYGAESHWSDSLSVTISGNTDAPDYPKDPSPSDGATDIPVTTKLSCLVSDPNNDPIDVTFVWGNETGEIGSSVLYGIISNNRPEITVESLEHNTSYWWYVEAYDGIYTTKSKTWHFRTVWDDVPPLLDIIRPSPGYLYCDRFNIAFDLKSIFGDYIDFSIILGKFNITANASDSMSGVKKVEIYIDDILSANISNPPYYWMWTERSFTPSVIKIIAYDNQKNSVTKEISIWKLF